MAIRKEFIETAPTSVIYRMFNCDKYFYALDDESRTLIIDELLFRHETEIENMFF